MRNRVLIIERRRRKMNRPCLYCGKEMQRLWDEYTPYYECDCKDAKLERMIEEQVRELKKKLPKPRYEIATVDIFRRIKRRQGA
jgi:hypothetical protein